MGRKKGERMILVTFHISQRDLKMLDEIVRIKEYSSRSEAIRIALRELLDKYARRYLAKETNL